MTNWKTDIIRNLLEDAIAYLDWHPDRARDKLNHALRWLETEGDRYGEKETEGGQDEWMY